jgi:hypothetical protein
MSDPRPPTMQRSRGQLATAYAPHSLFTFEGGAGACMALPASGNRPADLHDVTRHMIGEQIQEYFDAWAARATRGQNLGHPVDPVLAVDRRVLVDGVVRVRLGDLVFQVPDLVGYIPFPLAFVCSRCGLHRECRRLSSFPQDASRFREACPTGAENCAEDWQQLDVVMAHWSGEVEPLTPSFRFWSSSGEVQEITKCRSCESERFYLRRPPGAFSGWHFECVTCRSVRQLLQRDRVTLETLGRLIDQGLAVLPEINMEPVSYRASAAYYPHGDRLLVFDQDRYVSLLNVAQSADLQGFLATKYGYPPAQLDDAAKERLLRAAGRLAEWENYTRIRELIALVEAQRDIRRELIEAQIAALSRQEDEWNATVFAQHQQAAPGIATACRERQGYVRRFDPIRMAVEHETLAEEKLHGGEMSDGKHVSVDLTILDEFLIPDGLVQADVIRMTSEVSRRLSLLGIQEMRLVRDVRVCEYTFGYTRTSAMPIVKRERAGDAELPVRLRLFNHVTVGDGARHPVLCLVQSNEGFYVRLDEEAVVEWLNANDIHIVPAPAGVRLGGRLIEEFAAIQNDQGARFSRFLDEYRREGAQPRCAYPYVYTLLHTMAHHLISTAASMSGLDLGSFGEHLFVPDLSFLVYRRGMTMDLGNLSSMWRDRGDPVYGNEVLDRMVDPASLRCGSESICNHRGGACPDCILIPESTCITRNELLSRSVLVGRGAPRWDTQGTPLTGYYDIAARRAVMLRPAAV